MDNIQVGIRSRPLIDNEKAKNLVPQWVIQHNNIFQVDENGQRISEPYSFDHIFDEDKSNKAIYNDIVQEFVQSSIDGLNSTIFAYGQTSSGKTHTMTGNAHDPGIMVLAIDDIFNKIKHFTTRKYLLRISYIEIYNEKIIDLLDPVSKEIKIREQLRGGISLQNVREEIVTCTEQVHHLLNLGNNKKHISETKMNERSSRSHTILRFLIESTEDAVKISYLNLVDLAGSERVAHTKATGVRLKEGGHINKSLSALSLVIKQLSDGNEFINFRDSKLTRLLQDSLGGNAKTLVIAAITVASIEDTHSTLSFAQRAKTVKNKPKINEIVSDQEMHKRYAQLNENLKGKLEEQLQLNRQLSHTQESSRRKIKELQDQLELLENFQYGKPQEEVLIPKRRHTIGFPGQKKQLQVIKEIAEEEVSIPFIPSVTYSREDCMSPILQFDEFTRDSVDDNILTPSPVSKETPKRILRERFSHLDKEFKELVSYTSEEQEIHKKRDREIEELTIAHISMLEELEKLKANRNEILEQNQNLLELKSLHLQKIKTLEDNLSAKEREYQKIKTEFEQQETHKFEEELIVNQWKNKLKRRENELLEQINNLEKNVIRSDNTVIETKEVACDAGSEWYDSMVNALLVLHKILAHEMPPTDVLETSQLVNDSLLNKMETSRQIIQEEINKQVVKLDQFDDWLEDISNISNEVEGFSHLLQEFTILNEVSEINDQTEKVDEIKFFLNVYKCLLKVNRRYTVYTEKMRYDKNLLESLKTDLVCVQNKLQSVELDSNSQKDENCKLKKTVEVLEKEIRKTTDYCKKQEEEWSSIFNELSNSLHSTSSVLNESLNESLNEQKQKNDSLLKESEKHLETVKKCNTVIEDLKTEVEIVTQSYAVEKESLDHYVNLTHILDNQIVSLADENTKKHNQLIDFRNEIRKLKKNLRHAEKLNMKQQENITSFEMQLSEVQFLQEDVASMKTINDKQKMIIDSLELENRENYENLQKIKSELEEKVTVLNTLESQKEQLIAESKFTNQQLQKYVILVGEYEEQLQSAQNTLKESQENNFHLLSKLDSSEEINNNKLQLLDEKLQSLTQNIAERDNEIRELKATNEQYKVKINEHHVVCQTKLDLEQEVKIKDELYEKIAILNTELTSIVTDNKNLITTKEDNEKQILLLTNTNINLLDRISTLEKRIEEEVQKLKIEQGSCADSDNEIIKLQKRFDIVNIENQSLQQSILQFKNNNVQLKKDFEKCKYENETEINLLSQKNMELLSQIDELRNEVTSLKKKHERLVEIEEELENKNKEISQKEDVIVTLQFEKTKLYSEINNLKIQIESNTHVISKYEADFDNCNQQKLHEINEKYKTLEEKLKAKNNLIEDLKEQISVAYLSANETINKLKATIQNQTDEIVKSQQKIGSMLESHQNQIKVMNEKTEAIQEKYNYLEKKQHENNKEYQKLLVAKHGLEKTVSDLIDRRDKLQNQLDEQVQRMVAVEEELKDMTNQYDNICKTLEAEKEIYKLYKKKENGKILELQQSLNYHRSKISALQNQLSEKEQECNQDRQHLEMPCQQCPQFKEELKKVKREVSQKMKEIVSLQLQVFSKSKPIETPSSDLMLHYQNLCREQQEKINKFEENRVLKQSIEIQCNIESSNKDYDALLDKYERIKKVCVMRQKKIDGLNSQLKQFVDR